MRGIALRWDEWRDSFSRRVQEGSGRVEACGSENEVQGGDRGRGEEVVEEDLWRFQEGGDAAGEFLTSRVAEKSHS